MIGNENKIIILSACPVSEDVWQRYYQPGDFVIACDAGYRNAQRLGTTPDIVVGDFDSAPQPEWDNLVILPHVKDDTDTHYAATLAAQKHPKQVVLLGALGGKRMEHTLANLSTGLWLAKQGIEVVLADQQSELHYLLPGKPLTLKQEEWFYLSLFPLGEQLEGVCERGTFYPLENAVLTHDYPLGVSNEFVEEIAVLSCTAGFGIVVLTKAD